MLTAAFLGYTITMPAVLTPHEDGTQTLIPAWIKDNASFLRWAESEDAPQRGKIGYFQGQVWIDQTMETDFHNLIKTEIAVAVLNWTREQGLGRYYTDGMLFSDPDIQLSSEPDGIFVSKESKATGKVWLEKGKESMVLFGVPDMVLEVVSKSSRKKDLILLRDLYHEAGITEYWVVNSLDEQPVLTIYRHSAKAYVSVRSQDGWVKSQVLGAAFRLVVKPQADEVHLERK